MINKEIIKKSLKWLIVFGGLFTSLIFLFYNYIFFGEHEVCEKSSKVKADGRISISEKGVCFERSICNQLEEIVKCKNLNNGFDERDSKIVKNLNKNNFRFENIDARIDRILFIFKEDNYAIFLANKKYYKIENIDPDTFQYLGGKYSKDKNHVYYKNEIIEVDLETFIYERGNGKAIGKGRDKNGTWIKGILQDK